MPVSSYQVQRLLQEFRRIRGMTPVEEKPGPDADRVLFTEQADQLAQVQREQRALLDQKQPVWPEELQDRTPRPPSVDYELERRAGSFMQPPVELIPPLTIPKMKR